jgi:hypothetical protein
VKAKQVEAGFLRVRQLARMVAVGQNTVLGWIKSGELAAFNVAPRQAKRPQWRIDPAAWESFVASRKGARHG